MVDAGARTVRRARGPKVPADPRVLACINRYTDWPSIRDCIGAEGPSPADAGADRKFGAVRPPGTANQAWLVPDWYVDPAGGNDRATCVTAGAPCKSFGEIRNRSQGASTLAQTTTIHLLTSDTMSDPFALDPTIVTGGSLTLLCSTTTLSSGTLSGVVPKNRNAGQALNVNLGASAAGAVGNLLNNTTRAAWSFVDGIVSGNVVRMQQPFLTDDVTEVDTYTNGDSWTVQQPVTAYVSVMQPNVIDAAGFVEVLHCNVPPGPNSSFLTATGTTVSFQESTVGAIVLGKGITVANAMLTGGPTLEDSFVIGGELTQPIILGRGGGSEIGSDVIIHTEAIIAGSGLTRYDFVYTDALFAPTGGTLYPSGPSAFYGPSYQIQADSSVFYCGTNYPATCSAANSFLGGPTLTLFNAATANAYDRTTSPAQLWPNRALTVANLDTPVAGGGFDGLAESNVLGIGFYNFNKPGTSVTPTPIVWPVPNGGTGATSGPAHATAVWEGAANMSSAGPSSAGLVLESNGGAADPSFQAVVNSLTAGANISLSASTGNVTISASGGGIACPVNLATCTTGTLAVANGGTGGTSYPTGCVVEGSGGSSPLSCITPPWLTTISGITAGGDLSGTYPNPKVAGIQTRPVTATAPGTGQAYEWNGAAWAPNGLAGDVTGSLQSTVVGALQGRTVASTAPTAGQALTWNGSTWTPAAVSPPAAFAYLAGATIPATNTITTIQSATLTPASGSHLRIDVAFDFQSPSLSAENVYYGIGVNTPGSYTESRTLTLPANAGGSYSYGAASLVWSAAATGSAMTVYCLASVDPTISYPTGSAISAGCHLGLTQVP